MPGCYVTRRDLAGAGPRSRGSTLDPDQAAMLAVKEYPGGFALLRVHEGGYAINFHKLGSDDAMAWSERSRTQIGGTWPQFSLGSRVADRNLVVERDLSGLAPAPERSVVPPTTSERAQQPSGGSSSSSSSSWLPAGGIAVAVAAAGAGGVLALRRRGERGADAPRAEDGPEDGT